MNETTGNLYGYIRVSTKEQNEDRQRLAMHEFGIKDSDIFMDKQSGKDFDRPQYKRLIRKLKLGDTFVIKSIDRLGRNYEEILEQWRIITREKKAALVVLDMPLLDTRQGRDLTGTLIADIVLQLLSYVAQTEREFIRQRQAEGIAAAKARGVHMGRSPMEIPDDSTPIYDQWKRGELSGRGAARLLGVAQHTFTKWASAQV
ncbi:MAG: recombinase family protein [Firmicutes bacterium]|nr:recombinase family protein [Bacillota bacterium]MBQ3199431.1 recombinase family protein [Bacillota bacterium]